MANILHSQFENLNSKYDAFKYQHEAFEAIKDKQYAAIFHEQGLGKTKIAIDLFLYWFANKGVDSVLIVTKKQLVYNWIGEIQNHTFIKPKILTGNRHENYYVFNSPARVIITNFEVVSSQKERLKLYLKTRKVGIIIDESTKIKNADSKLTQDFFEVSELFEPRVIMTGTPIANRPYDIWAQIFFLDKGNSLGADFKAFKKDTDLSNDLGQDSDRRELFEECVASIFSSIKDFTVRETKNSGIITLPNKVYHTVTADFEAKQKEMYEAVREDMFLTVQKGDETLYDESEESIKRLLRLVQITSNPALIDDMYCNFSAKEKLLDDLIKKIIGRKEKVIVWSIFTDNVNYLCSKYKDYNSVKITGKLDMQTRNKAVVSFKEGDAQILFATPQSAKEGLTLTVANNVIFYDRGFNLDDYLQAQDRIHRISQTKECNIYNLMVNGSIDFWIDRLLSAKQTAAFLAQGDYDLAKFRDNIDYSFGDLVREILNIEA